MGAVKEALCRPVLKGEEGTWIGFFRFPADFPGFAGHFPAYPILPAVVQLMAVQAVLEEAQRARPRLLRLERAKFLERIFPDQEIRVQCRLKEAGEEKRVEAELTVNGKKAAAFRLGATWTS